LSIESSPASEKYLSTISSPPTIISATASASNGSYFGYTYIPENAIDGDVKTVWAPPGKEDENGNYGINQHITLRFDGEYEIKGISLINGWAHPDTNYSKYRLNARIKRVKVTVSNGYSEEFALVDNEHDYQDLKFKSPQKTKYVKVTILEVYTGDSEKMSCISEIKIL
jgi:hypothetical protein